MSSSLPGVVVHHFTLSSDGRKGERTQQKTAPRMINGCIYCFQGTFSETLVIWLLHANRSPTLVSLLPFSAQGTVEGVLEGFPEPGPNENLQMGKNWRSLSSWKEK